MVTLAFTILPIIPLVAWFVLVGWSPSKVEGDLLLQVPMTVLSRVKVLWLPFALGLVALMTGYFMGRLPGWTYIAYTLICAAVLAVPISYTLTTVGIRTGQGVFRRWTEFAGVRRSPSGAVLQGGPRATSYPIFLSGNREDDDFVLTLKNLVQDSYKGKATLKDRIRESGVQSPGATSTTSSINH